jgi:hypothetical protein
MGSLKEEITGIGRIDANRELNYAAFITNSVPSRRTSIHFHHRSTSPDGCLARFLGLIPRVTIKGEPDNGAPPAT